MEEQVRFADVLTTAAAVANYLGARDVTASHMLDAVAILRGQKTLDDLGRPVSPLVVPRGERGADHAVRDLAQRWWSTLGGEISATFDEPALREFEAELRRLAEGEG